MTTGSLRDWPLAAGLAAGVAADALAGDPARGHPVALFGRAMSALERRVYADDRADRRGPGRGRPAVRPRAAAAPVRPPEPADIGRAVRLSRAVTASATALAAALALAPPS